MHEGSRRAILAAFLADPGIAVATSVGFVITGSAGLLAAAGHSPADTGNQLLLLPGGKRTSTVDDAGSLRSAGSIRRIIRLRTGHLGPDQLPVAAELEFDPAPSGEELAGAIERDVRAAVPTAQFVFLAPDVYRAAAA